VIELQPWDPKGEYARAGLEERIYDDFFGLKILHLNIPVKEGRSMAVLVEAAVTDFILMQRGFDMARDFEVKVYDFIKNRKGDEEWSFFQHRQPLYKSDPYVSNGMRFWFWQERLLYIFC